MNQKLQFLPEALVFLTPMGTHFDVKPCSYGVGKVQSVLETVDFHANKATLFLACLECLFLSFSSLTAVYWFGFHWF